jgi:hypothetical protein
MPLPTPSKDEKQQDFVSRCISFETKASPGRDPKQVQAMCYTAWRKAKGEKLSEEDFNTLEHYALFADNQGYDSQFTKKKGIKLWRKQVLKFGTWIHPDNKDITFEITPNVVKQIIANFNSGVPDEAPVVLTHTDDPQKKTGRIKSFVETPEGLDAVFSCDDEVINDKIEKKSDSTPGVSCWLDLNYKDKQTGDELGAVVKHVALVNHPYIEGMSGFNAVLSSFEDAETNSSTYLPLVMSEKKKAVEDEVQMADLSKEELVKVLKEKHNLDVEALLSSSEELTTLHDRIDKGELIDSKSVSLGEDLLKQIKEKLALSAADNLGIPELVKKLLEKVASLSTAESKLSEVEKQLVEFKADKEVAALLSEGRILPVEKDVFLSMFRKTPEVFTEMAKVRRDMKKTLVELSETGVAYEPQVGDAAKEALARNLKAAEDEGRIKKAK